MEGAINSIAYPAEISPLAPVPSLARIQALTRWAVWSKRAFGTLLPLAPRWQRRDRRHNGAKAAAAEAAAQALAVLEREKRRRWGGLVPPEPVPKGRELEALEVTLHMCWVIANHPGLPFSARENARRDLVKAKARLLRNNAQKPPVPAAVAVRPSLPAPQKLPKVRQRTPRPLGSTPRDGPEDSEGGEGEEDGESSSDPPPQLPPRARARGRGRGRPRKARRFRAHPHNRTYRKRREKLNAVAEALERGRESYFLTLVPLTPPSEEDRRLAAVPAEVARAFAGFAARLRRAKVPFALVVATRADSGAFFPHAHGIVGGVSREMLARWAAREGLGLHVEALRSPRAAAKYLTRARQKRHFDGVFGSRGFYAYVPARAVSSRNNTAARAKAPGPAAPAPLEAPAGPAGEEAPRGVSSRNIPGEIPPGLEISPGIRIADSDHFLAALLRDLGAPIPAVRDAARHRLALLQKALAKGGPP